MSRSFPRPSLHALAAALSLALAAAAAHAQVPAHERVVVVVMENKSYDQVRLRPYTASLMAQGATFTTAFGTGRPSQPNYLALWAGSMLGVTTNNCPPAGSPYSAENLGHACEAAGISWRAYSENLAIAGSAACSYDGTASTGLYTRKHAPWTQFTNLNHNNERPYTDLAADIAAGTLPRLVFIVPNNCHNSHNSTDPGCSIQDADNWLAANLPAVRAALGPRGLLVLTWDEDDGGSTNHILTTFVGPQVVPGSVYTPVFTHYALNRTITDALGLSPMGNGGAELPPSGIWQAVVPTRGTSWGQLKAHYR